MHGVIYNIQLYINAHSAYVIGRLNPCIVPHLHIDMMLHRYKAFLIQFTEINMPPFRLYFTTCELFLHLRRDFDSNSSNNRN